MKILQLAARMPYPLTDGGAIGIYNITKSLAKLGHDVTLVTFPLDTEAETREAVEDISRFAKVRLTKHPLPARWKVLLRTLFKGPYPIERRMMPDMFALLDRILQSEKFDICHVDHAHMGRYGLWVRDKYGLPIVLREHNFEALIYERFEQVETNPVKKWLAAMHGRRLKQEEIGFLKQYDGIAAISLEDERIMREFAPEANYRIIPAGVDADYFSPSTKAEQPTRLLWVGTFAWDPNFDAIRHFFAAVFPEIKKRAPEAKFDIIGAQEDRIRSSVAPFSDSVRLLGRVPDVRDYLVNSAVLVVPLRIGGGMRLKLLEFFAAGKAVVSTSIGAEGNIAEDGVHLLIRDSDVAFAEAVVQLMRDETLRKRLGAAARDLAVRVYSWDHIAEQFTGLYSDVIERSFVPHS